MRSEGVGVGSVAAGLAPPPPLQATINHPPVCFAKRRFLTFLPRPVRRYRKSGWNAKKRRLRPSVVKLPADARAIFCSRGQSSASWPSPLPLPVFLALVLPHPPVLAVYPYFLTSPKSIIWPLIGICYIAATSRTTTCHSTVEAPDT